MYDAEHFFDAYRCDPEYAIKCMQTACEAGADWLVLCDTNGSSLPEQVATAIRAVIEKVDCKVGVHTHNDCELAVANSLAAVEAGALQVQGTINGYGERCGNANLISLIPTMQLKMGYACVPSQALKKLTEVARAVSEIANLNPDPALLMLALLHLPIKQVYMLQLWSVSRRATNILSLPWSVMLGKYLFRSWLVVAIFECWLPIWVSALMVKSRL